MNPDTLANTRRSALDLGLYLSFSGILTFKNADELRQTAANAPLDQLLVEEIDVVVSAQPGRPTISWTRAPRSGVR